MSGSTRLGEYLSAGHLRVGVDLKMPGSRNCCFWPCSSYLGAFLGCPPMMPTGPLLYIGLSFRAAPRSHGLASNGEPRMTGVESFSTSSRSSSATGWPSGMIVPFFKKFIQSYLEFKSKISD